jgi:hypothetical protein
MSDTTTPTDVKIELHIGDQLIPISSFEVTSGSYGSVGHARAVTSRAMLEGLQIDLLALASSSTIVPFNVYAEAGSVALMKIFDGDLLSSEWEFDSDAVVIHARDHAGVFVDQKRILARDAKAVTAALTPLSPGQQLSPTGVSTINRKVSEVVSDIATQFGYTPTLNMGSGSNVIAGAVYGASDHAYMTIPQNLWTILNTLARDTGNEVYTTPDRHLVFGVPGAGLPTIQLSYNVPQDLASQSLPCASLRVTHNPRRHDTFRVLVTSYDPGKAQTTVGRATFIGDGLAGTGGLSPGVHVGSDALSADKQLLKSAQTKEGGSSSSLSHVQLYTFHWDGMTNDDASARAAAIANDIAKRLLLLNCHIDGLPSIVPTQKLIVSGPTLPGSFAGNTWYVSGFRHMFVLPSGGRSPRSGYITEIQALDLPSNALTARQR